MANWCQIDADPSSYENHNQSALEFGLTGRAYQQGRNDRRRISGKATDPD